MPSFLLPLSLSCVVCPRGYKPKGKDIKETGQGGLKRVERDPPNPHWGTRVKYTAATQCIRCGGRGVIYRFKHEAQVLSRLRRCYSGFQFSPPILRHLLLRNPPRAPLSPLTHRRRRLQLPQPHPPLAGTCSTLPLLRASGRLSYSLALFLPLFLPCSATLSLPLDPFLSLSPTQSLYLCIYLSLLLCHSLRLYVYYLCWTCCEQSQSLCVPPVCSRDSYSNCSRARV